MSGYLVCGWKRDEEDEGYRFECETLEVTAAVVADLLRKGCAWVHVDSLAVLNVQND